MKNKLLIVLALVLIPSAVIAAPFCAEWINVPEECPSTSDEAWMDANTGLSPGEYQSHEHAKKCGIEWENKHKEHWKVIGAQINELAEELPDCALVWQEDTPCMSMVGSRPPVENL